jgi:hypothetical protein
VGDCNERIDRRIHRNFQRLKAAVGQKKFEEFNGPLWYEAGKGAKEFAHALGLPTESPGDVEGITHLLAKTSMGAGV